jgi:hypothetical protein
MELVSGVVFWLSWGGWTSDLPAQPRDPNRTTRIPRRELGLDLINVDLLKRGAVFSEMEL